MPPTKPPKPLPKPSPKSASKPAPAPKPGRPTTRSTAAGGPAEAYTPADVARVLKLTVRQLRRMREKGRVPAPARLGRHLRWPKPVIDAWLAAGCPRTAA